MPRQAFRRAAQPLALSVSALLALAVGCGTNQSVAPTPPSEPPPAGSPGTWQDLGLSSSFVEVQALATWNGLLIAGGTFYDVGGFASTSLASWDGATWSRIGPQIGGGVSALTVYNDRLVVGGNFIQINGDPIRRVGEWDGTTWRALGEGSNRSVFSLAVYNGDLIAGGAFDSIGGVPASCIARWDGAAWHPLGDGLNNAPWALTVYNGALVAGGSFDRAGGVLAPGIASWNGSSWSTIGGGVFGGAGGNPYGTVFALGRHGASLVAGGGFTAVGDIPVHHVAIWNGAEWDSLGGGLGTVPSEYVKCFAEYGDDLVAGGTFEGNVRRWDGQAWTPMSSLNGSVNALTVYFATLVAGGYFPKDPGYYANGIAKWVK